MNYLPRTKMWRLDYMVDGWMPLRFINENRSRRDFLATLLRRWRKQGRKVRIDRRSPKIPKVAAFQ